MNSATRDPDLTLAVIAGTHLVVRVPAQATPIAPLDLSAIDVSGLKGATIPLSVGFRRDALTLRTACVTAPSQGFVPGVEGLVLERATAIATATIGGVLHVTTKDPEVVDRRFEQRFEGTVQREPEALSLQGRHWMGFAGSARDAVVCTIVCTEPSSLSSCRGLVEGARAEGAWMEAPPPSMVVRGIFYGAAHPGVAGAIGGAVLLFSTALVIARRPRPRP